MYVCVCMQVELQCMHGLPKYVQQLRSHVDCRIANFVLFACTHIKTEEMGKRTKTTATTALGGAFTQRCRPQVAESEGQSTGWKQEVLVLCSVMLATRPSDPKHVTDQASVFPLQSRRKAITL